MESDVLPDNADELVSGPGDVRWLTEADIAARLRMLRADSTSWLGPGSTGEFSLGGAQAKTALHHAAGRLGAPTGSISSTHILKPAVAGHEAQNVNEHLCLATARVLGLPAASTRIEAFDDETAIVIDRFDRTIGDGALARVHQEDLCQAMSAPPARKHQADGDRRPPQEVQLPALRESDQVGAAVRHRFGPPSRRQQRPQGQALNGGWPRLRAPPDRSAQRLGTCC